MTFGGPKSPTLQDHVSGKSAPEVQFDESHPLASLRQKRSTSAMLRHASRQWRESEMERGLVARSGYLPLPLVNEQTPYRLNVAHRNPEKVTLYYRDLFHTFINLSLKWFWLIFVMAFVLQYLLFGAIYYFNPRKCVPGIEKFRHAVWFSVQTSATIGYGGMLTPDPECDWLNLTIMIQAVLSALIEFALLGVVFARFSSPTGRARTLRFSKSVLLSHKGGKRRLSFRVANIRSHQILRPEVRALLSMKRMDGDDNEDNTFQYEELPISGSQVSRDGYLVFLGLPCVLHHHIDDHSPLHSLTISDLVQREAEIIVLLSGVDGTTSSMFEARHSYMAANFLVGHEFIDITLRNKVTGQWMVDFVNFDTTRPVQADKLPQTSDPKEEPSPKPADREGFTSPSGKADDLFLHGYIAHLEEKYTNLTKEYDEEVRRANTLQQHLEDLLTYLEGKEKDRVRTDPSETSISRDAM